MRRMRRDIAKAAAEDEGRIQRDEGLRKLMAARAVLAAKTAATAKQILVQEAGQSAAERKAMAEKAMMMALAKKLQMEEAVKVAAAQANAIQGAAEEATAWTKAREDETPEEATAQTTPRKDAAAEAADQEETPPDEPVPKKMVRKAIAAAECVAKAAAAAEKQKELEELQLAKDTAYATAMHKNNAVHLINNPFSLPDSAPPWLTELVGYLPDNKLGSEWCGCIQVFVTLHMNMDCADMVSKHNDITGLCLPPLK